MPPSLPSDSPEVSMLPESLQFLRLIWSLTLGLERTSEHMATNMGVTGRQRFILRVAGLIPGVTAGQLGAMLQIDRSALDAELDHLVATGLLASPGGHTGAQKALHITPPGAAANAKMPGTVESAVTRALDEATPYERAAFRRMLERVTPYLDPAR